MVDYKDYYKTLGVAKGAPDKEIKQAYRRLARKYHPDVNPGDAKAEDRFKEIGEAYAVLGDPEKRKKYDQFGPSLRNGSFWHEGRYGPRNAPHPYTARDFAKEFETETTIRGMGSGFSEFFEALFGQGAAAERAAATGYGAPAARPRPEAPPARGGDIEQSIEVTLEEVFSGGNRIFSIQIPELCPTCHGSALVNGKLCATCQGAGTVTRGRRIDVKIPPGVRDGSRIKLSGEGNPGATGGPKGDLYLVVKVQPHPTFDRQGNDLYVEVPVPLLKAVLGGEVEVPTLKGTRLSMRVPPETQNGRTFRLSGQGLPALRGDEHGDLYSKVRVILPTNLSARERDLFQELKKHREGPL
ncbi:MAG TPA: DnaJ C-terminal domain-containing protein [Chloroflexota bacterium]|nr:DnaJ C-terminal domain-containing protein [Chloroflexota bacterium]